MENGKTAAADHKQACRAVRVLFPQRWLRSYVAGKMRSDPIFRAAGDLLGNSELPLLDIGCGVGLLPLYLRSRGFRPAITGLDIDARKLDHAAHAAALLHDETIEFFEHDIVHGLPDFEGNVTLFDVLHYLKPTAQRTLLWKLATRIVPGGMLLLRDCPHDYTPRFWATYLGEKFAQTVRWNLKRPLHFPTRESINHYFPPNEFSREEIPMWGRGPFNNRMFVFRRLQALS